MSHVLPIQRSVTLWLCLVALCALGFVACTPDGDGGSSRDGTSGGTSGSDSTSGSTSGTTSDTSGSTSGTTSDTSGSTSGTSGGLCDGSFDACGGDLLGTWTMQETCVEAPSTSPIPNCPDATNDQTINITGTLTFEATQIINNLSIAYNGTQVIPKSCFPEGFSCEAMSSMQCTDGGDVCNCTYSGTDTDTTTDAYTLEGNTIVIPPEDAASQGTRIDFCINGSTLIGEGSSDNTLGTVRYRLTR